MRFFRRKRNMVRLFHSTNDAGERTLCARFPSGTAHVIATEPRPSSYLGPQGRVRIEGCDGSSFIDFHFYDDRRDGPSSV